MQIANFNSLLQHTQPPLPPELKPAAPSPQEREAALQKAAAPEAPSGADALPVAPQDAQVHDELLRFPERREALYRQLAGTDPGLIHRLEQAQPADASAKPGPPSGDTLRQLAKAANAAASSIQRALQPQLTADGAERAAAALPAPPASPATPATPAEAPSPAEQAQADAVALQTTYDDALARTGNEAKAAEAASAKLDQLTAEHAGDSAYTSTLLRAARPTLDRIGQVLGRHVNGEFNGNGADKNTIVATVQNLARAAGRSGEFGAALIAHSIAPNIPDRSELRKLDDAFYGYIEHGGDTRLFQALAGQLQGLGKARAAEELLNKHEGLLGRIVGGVREAIGSAAGAVKSVAGDVVHIVRDGAELSVDLAQGTVDAIGDGAEALGKAAEFAAENGLKLVGKAYDFAVDTYRKVLDHEARLGQRINELGEGDSYELSIDVEVALEVGVEAGRGVTVERTAEGYEVSGYLNGQISLKDVAGGSAGGGGMMTFFAKTPEEAHQLALMLASGPKTSEVGFARQHLRSVELDSSAALQLDVVKLGIGDIREALGAGLQVDIGLKLEFENGQPTNLLVVGRASVGGEASADDRAHSAQLTGIRQLAQSLGIDLPDRFAAEGEAELTFETRIAVLGMSRDDVENGLQDPDARLRDAAMQARTSVTVDGSYDTATNGQKAKGTAFHFDITGLDRADAKTLLKGLASGQVPSALTQISFDADGWTADYTRQDHSVLKFNYLIIGAVGGAINTEANYTDVDWEHRKPVHRRFA